MPNPTDNPHAPDLPDVVPENPGRPEPLAVITLTSVVRTGGKVYVNFGKRQREFQAPADVAASVAGLEDEAFEALQNLLLRVAVARNLIPANGGPVNLRLTYNPNAPALAAVLNVVQLPL